MNVSLRKFCEQDIPLKVRWINDPETNRYLHYDLPLQVESTLAWFLHIRDESTRMDMTILCDDAPVGIIGLLQINFKKKSAELYVTLGEKQLRGKGVAALAMEQLLRIAFTHLGLHRVYLFTETENAAAVHAYEKFGFVKEGCLRDETITRFSNFANRYIYSILKSEFEARYGLS